MPMFAATYHPPAHIRTHPPLTAKQGLPGLNRLLHPSVLRIVVCLDPLRPNHCLSLLVVAVVMKRSPACAAGVTVRVHALACLLVDMFTWAPMGTESTVEFSESIRGSQWDDAVFDEGDTIELTVTSPKPRPLVFKLRYVPSLWLACVLRACRTPTACDNGAARSTVG